MIAITIQNDPLKGFLHQRMVSTLCFQYVGINSKNLEIMHFVRISYRQSDILFKVTFKYPRLVSLPCLFVSSYRLCSSRLLILIFFCLLTGKYHWSFTYKLKFNRFSHFIIEIIPSIFHQIRYFIWLNVKF